ncbi:hypothetical protein BCR43DRAFT_526106 [Syncephalastrum racemosum]|uniref:AMP-dependent synthetase/ligase domain-containing protein n=1 Tax=Syncephalastrum racemosum TaxID=13706 RepID=A0A1X2H8Y8_SYNRA|nr:hypothetical protein BCR43DRAFT_526106 [Syncephalastrum racemosum]
MISARETEADDLYSRHSTYELLFEPLSEEDKDTVIFVDAEQPDRFYTLATLRERILKLGGFLQQKYQWQNGDILAICAENDASIDYPVALHASVAIGGISSAVDQHYPANDIANDLQLIEPKLVITDAKTYDKVVAAAKMSNVANPVVTFEELDRLVYSDVDIAMAEPIRYTPEQLVTTPAYIYFTSGTTGKKKGAIMTQSYMTAILQYLEECIPGGFRALSYTEFHHVSQLVCPAHWAIRRKMTYYIMRTSEAPPDPYRVCEAMQEFKIDTLVCQPYMVNAFAKEPWVDKFDLSAFKYAACGGSMPDASILRACHQRFGAKIVALYGMTECLPILLPNWESTIIGSQGRKNPMSTLKIIDDNGNDVHDTGETGELCVKTSARIPGYWKNPDETKALFDEEGFLRTGDLFQCRDGEYYFITRKKELFKYFLHHIYPQDIEGIVLRHPAVTEACVLGRYSKEQATELPAAFVMLHQDNRAKVDEAEKQERLCQDIQTFVNERVPDPHRLRGGVFIVDSFPRTAFGKIKRNKLNEQYFGSEH